VKLNEYISHIRTKYPRIGQSTGPAGMTPSEQADAYDNLKNLLPEVTTLTTIYTNMLKAQNTETNNLIQGIGRFISAQKGIVDAQNDLIKQSTWLEQRYKGLNTAFKLTSESAEIMAIEVRKLSGDLGRSEDTIQKQLIGLKGLTGGYIASNKVSAEHRKGLIQSRILMTQNLGVSEEAAEGMQRYAAALGQSIGGKGGILEQYDKQGGLIDKLVDKTGFERSTLLSTIMEGIGSTAADIRYTTSKIPGNLEVAVLKSKALGVSFAQLQSTGKELLNIEQSVGEELNYQMLTGERLLDDQGNSITNQYRTAYLMGDQVKQQNLLRQAIEDQAENLKNPVYLEQFSKMFGMQGDQVVKTLEQINQARDLGLSAVLEMTNPEDVSKELANAREAYVKAGKGSAAQFDTLANEFMEGKDSILTTHEQKVEQSLSTIAKDLASFLRKQGIVTEEDKNKKIKAQSTVVKTGQETSEAIKKQAEKEKEPFTSDKLDGTTGKNMIMKAGDAANKKAAVTFADAVSDAAGNIAPGNQTPNKVDTSDKDIIQTKPDPNQSGPQNTTNPEIKEGTDVLIMPDRGPIIRPAKNDVIAAFRPNDVIANTLNQTAMPSATTAPAIDINALASAIASAVSKITVEATIKQDTFLGTTNMNNPRLFT
jgi:hypothetical protein